MMLMEPVGQLFIADGEIDTQLCFNNYFSVLYPEIHCGALGEIGLIDVSGKLLLTTVMKLAYNGSAIVSVGELLDRAGLSCSVGMVTLLLAPGQPELFEGEGKLYANFFTRYVDSNRRSMCTIHPQSAIRENGPVESWRSNQAIHTQGLARLSVYQANHSESPRTITYTLFDFETNEPVLQESLDLSPLSAGVAHLPIEGRNQPPVLYLKVDSLASPNGKPLLMRRFKNGTFSMSHA